MNEKVGAVAEGFEVSENTKIHLVTDEAGPTAAEVREYLARQNRWTLFQWRLASLVEAL